MNHIPLQLEFSLRRVLTWPTSKEAASHTLYFEVSQPPSRPQTYKVLASASVG
jgi:hypothetical protein